jgi:hypothetical protein
MITTVFRFTQEKISLLIAILVTLLAARLFTFSVFAIEFAWLIRALAAAVLGGKIVTAASRGFLALISRIIASHLLLGLIVFVFCHTSRSSFNLGLS